MGFPWVFFENFDAGVKGNWSGTHTDPGNTSFENYAALAQRGYSPFEGAFAARFPIANSTTTEMLEATAFDFTVDTTRHFWMPICIPTNFVVADGTDIELFRVRSASVDEFVFGVGRDGDNYELFAGQAASTRTRTIIKNNSEWHQMEASVLFAASGAGTIDFFVDGEQVGAQIASLTNATTVQAQLGILSDPGASGAGDLLIGGLICDENGRIFPRTRFPADTKWVTDDMTAFIGPCTLDSAIMTATAGDGRLTLLDTDVFTSTGTKYSREPTVYISHVVIDDMSPGFNTPVEFKKGIYAIMTGTNPQAWVSIKRPSAVVQSSAQYVNKGLKRRGIQA